MRFAAWNIQRGLFSKIDGIQHMADLHKLDFFALSEVDLASDFETPLKNEFDCFRSAENPTRVIVYCRNTLKMKQVDYHGEMPAVVIESAQCTFAFVYGEFTAQPYSGLSISLTDKQRCTRIMVFLDWFNSIAKKNCFVAGDCNIHWESQNVSKIKKTIGARILDFCKL